MKKFFSENRTLLSVIWLVFTVSLGVWWFRLALSYTDQLLVLTKQIGGVSLPTKLEYYTRQHTMIQWEGIVFLTLLVFGGVILIWFVHRDVKRNQLIHDFFSTVTHEMRTPLTSLQLQIESILDDNKGTVVEHRLKKLLTENTRIELQMNKAFYLASLMRAERLFIEPVTLNELLTELTWDWPMLSINISDNVVISADKRALDSILKNLFENSINHGKATEIIVQVNNNQKSVVIKIRDNGTGFTGNLNRLGKAFERHSSTSGTGVGIYIIKLLIKKMKGSAQFKNLTKKGFLVILELPLVSKKIAQVKLS